MRKIIAIISFAVCLSLLFCSCADKGKTEPSSSQPVSTTQETTAVSKPPEDLMSAKDVMKDIADLDLYLKADYDGLTKKLKKDDESDTAKEYYYDGDTLVYVKYIGYSEELFEYYTKSKSGLDIVVGYTDFDGERESVGVTSDKYSVNLTELNKKAKYGADYILVNCTQSVENDFPKTVIYIIEQGKSSVFSSLFYAEDGYHRYSNSDGETDEIVFKKQDEIKPTENLLKLVSDYRVKNAEYAVGTESYSYTEKDGKKTWYMTADISLVFTDRNKAIDFGDKYKLEPKRSDADDSYWVVELDGAVVEISPKYTKLFDSALEEPEESYFVCIELDKNSRLENTSSGDALLTYY